MIAKKIIPPIRLLDKYQVIINKTQTIRSLGNVVEVAGNTIYSTGPDAKLGEICHIEKIEDESYIMAEVIGFKGNTLILSPMENITGIAPGCRILSTGHPLRVSLGEQMLGRVLDGLGNSLDNKGKLVSDEVRPLHNKPPNPLDRPIINEPMPLGIKAIDSLLTIGKGQRIGIFAGSGVGKSTILGMIARYAAADVNVIAMVGERGREVAEFIKNDLGEIGLKKSVLVVASSNESAMHRVRAAYLATTIAEYFRDKGKDVLLLMDTVTRLAMAQREIGLSAGEPATTRGYPPSVFSMLPELMERAGTSSRGTITGIYSVLAEADDMNDPIVDTTRGILDGHIILSRKLAMKSHYPAIDIVSSISRSMNNLVPKDQIRLAASIREMVSEYNDNEEIINLGAYVKGSNPVLDRSMLIRRELNDFLRQEVEQYQTYESTIEQLKNVYGLLSRDQRKVRRTG
ncbi:MAG: FliI/YscN family ATPase [Spirochaetia bacterium]|nr:FliI/YscN family ATPase [Spirochaetia bacterium]